jgi:hypothetical protein
LEDDEGGASKCALTPTKKWDGMTDIKLSFDANTRTLEFFRRLTNQRPSYTLDSTAFQSKSAEEVEQMVGGAVLMLLQQQHGSPIAARDYNKVAEEARPESRRELSSASLAGDSNATLALLQDEVSQALTTGSDCFADVEAKLERLAASGHDDARIYLLDRLPPLKAIWEKRHRRSAQP